LPRAFGRGLTASEVEQVLTAPGEDRPGALGSRIAIGQTAAGWHIRVIYVPEPDPQSAFVITAFTLEGTPLRAYQWRRKAGRSRPVTTDKYPHGWNGERVERVLSRYETQPSMTAVAEDEAALEAPGYTVMTLPTELVPAVRQLIAERDR
jgi:hypothetical protein